MANTAIPIPTMQLPSWRLPIKAVRAAQLRGYQNPQLHSDQSRRRWHLLHMAGKVLRNRHQLHSEYLLRGHGDAIGLPWVGTGLTIDSPRGKKNGLRRFFYLAPRGVALSLGAITAPCFGSASIAHGASLRRALARARDATTCSTPLGVLKS